MKEHGSRWSYGITVYGFGNLFILQGQYQKARGKSNTTMQTMQGEVSAETALQTMQEIGSRRNVTMIKSDLAHILHRQGSYLEAIASYQETILEWQRMGHHSAIAHQLECMAFIAKALEQAEKATTLLGAAEALRQRIEIDMTLPEHEEYDKEVADLKANMDEKEFASLWVDGRSMTMDEAIELATKNTKE